MRFKISQELSKRHKKTVTCVAWITSDEFFSCGDDHMLVSWKLEAEILNSKIVTEFTDDFFPTDMQWHPCLIKKGLGTKKKQAMNILLITTDDGKFHLVNKNGRIEKSTIAHNGAVICGKWSYDGAAFFTAGEDGHIKVWSRSGMLRSTVIRGSEPIFASTWSPDNSSILYSQGSSLLIKSLMISSKSQKWQAHEGLILVTSWSQLHGLIISGGEDCRHKVWSSSGNILYVSVISDHPITSVNWCFSGNYVAVGSFNTLKLCDKIGWSHSLEKIQAGSIYNIAWSNDSTQVALACSSGSIYVAHTIEKKLEYNGFQANLIKREAIKISQVGSNVHEILDIADRVVRLEFGFDHLVVLTPNQCHIYSIQNWNTPAIFDLKHNNTSAALLTNKHFLLVEGSFLTLYSYQGRFLGVPKWKGMTLDPLYTPCISVCVDTIVVRNQDNHKVLHIMEISQNKPITEIQSYTHVHHVVSLVLNHVGGIADRQLALIDKNRDLFLISIRSGFGRAYKIATMVKNIAWGIDANVLAGILDTTLSMWLCPSCVHYSDRNVIRKMRVDKDISEFGKHSSIINIQNGFITVRRDDGAVVLSPYYIFFTNLHQHVFNERWEEAVSLCRIVQNEIVWTCMVVMAIDRNYLNIAQEACAAIKRYDKVDYIYYIKKLPTEQEKFSQTALLVGDMQTTENILLQNGQTNEIIIINIEMYKWNRALELAIKYKKMLHELLYFRENYLQILGKTEVNQSFIAVKTNILKSLSNKTKFREKIKEIEYQE